MPPSIEYMKGAVPLEPVTSIVPPPEQVELVVVIVAVMDVPSTTTVRDAVQPLASVTRRICDPEETLLNTFDV